MEISDEKLRQIVRETLRELGPQADPALVHKVVREVVRRLLKPDLAHTGTAHPAQKFTLHSAEASARSASRQEY